MPIGSYSLTGLIAHELCKAMPKSVLDVGIGFGMQGALVRQWLDHGVQPYNVILEGIEGFTDYRSALWQLYDGIFEMSIQDFLTRNNGHYDFIIFTDVIEHFEKEEGYNVIQKLIGLLNNGGTLLIGTPGVFVPQHDVHGNEYERHRSFWAATDFPYGFNIIKNGQHPDEYGHMMTLVKYTKK